MIINKKKIILGSLGILTIGVGAGLPIAAATSEPKLTLKRQLDKVVKNFTEKHTTIEEQLRILKAAVADLEYKVNIIGNENKELKTKAKTSEQKFKAFKKATEKRFGKLDAKIATLFKANTGLNAKIEIMFENAKKLRTEGIISFITLLEQLQEELVVHRKFSIERLAEATNIRNKLILKIRKLEKEIYKNFRGDQVGAKYVARRYVKTWAEIDKIIRQAKESTKTIEALQAKLALLKSVKTADLEKRILLLESKQKQLVKRGMEQSALTVAETTLTEGITKNLKPKVEKKKEAIIAPNEKIISEASADLRDYVDKLLSQGLESTK